MSRLLFSKKEVQAATDVLVEGMDKYMGSSEASRRDQDPETWAALDKIMQKALIAAINYESNQLKKEKS